MLSLSRFYAFLNIEEDDMLVASLCTTIGLSMTLSQNVCRAGVVLELPIAGHY